MIESVARRRVRAPPDGVDRVRAPRRSSAADDDATPTRAEDEP